MEELNLVLAKNLKTIREQKKLSLERVAELTGVSKTMIGQIERGGSSPTITTVWKIANGLKVSFSSLIHEPQPDTEVVTKSSVNMLSIDNGRYRIFPYFPFDDERRFEVYRVEIDPEGYLDSESHNPGTEEFVTVFDGELTIMIKQQEHTINAGDSIRFKADGPHSYHNSGDKPVRLSMVIYYPE
ncbi:MULTISPECIES: helix-turn-helix domain-containing protein [Bacillaceae]|uniref:Helix-turn-helix domain-containing protein n=1 Tax=Metabacillus sediminis TaxID=3117746 RepID=A0ABZ2NIX4_9BACI|nr:helix-turn-helix domain-containing protein [Bacillus sp. SJS]KZZ83962.1 DNA-binding protein [Bacillus sp. SJS]